MTVRTRALIASGGALLLGLAVSGCGSSDPGDAPAEHKSFALGGATGKALTIDATNTTLELTPADVREVEVTRRVDGWVFAGSGPEAQWGLRDGTLTLRVKCRALISDCSSRHQVKVPRGVAVTVEGGNGKITASGFDTPLKLRNNNGTVTVRDSSGPLSLESHNGTVDAEGISAASVSAQCDNGRIRLGFASAPDLVKARSHNGSITIGLPGGSVKYAVSATAHNGRTSVDVPRSDDSSHVVEARSNNGRITVRTAN
ncbi:DUF4097 family beta strand repeat-containing protein [Streptomyces sp. CB01580]|uniref:DUF4097 family beta strand repeat-containing protein n=1 Tax=Streptomyces sp. CB01580 TaxID=1703933 RepID=UPI00093B6339|nr:DUF4097 family beta strand repeat-containing protein [Streptomyces sp. CB01580]OKJ33214.1 hypothetical protein AMK22_20655 [Streptomyces sp. CB01580]